MPGRTSYHNHTTWSDGAAGVAEMLAAARAAKLDEFGFSDHLVFYPGHDWFGWRLTPERLGAYSAEIRAAAEATDGIAVRIGAEVDFFPELERQLAAIVKPRPFDYLIGSVHFVDGFLIDGGLEGWTALSPDERDDVWRRYFERIVLAARSGIFDVIGHLDLPKRFGVRSPEERGAGALAALDAIAAAGIAIELNTAGWRHPVDEPYPSPWLLERARARGVPLVINADAHRPEHVAADFDRAEATARAAGYAEVVRFERRKRTSVSL